MSCSSCARTRRTADVAMATECSGAADGDVPQRPALHRSERVRPAILLAVTAEDRPNVAGTRRPPPRRASGGLLWCRSHRSARGGRTLASCGGRRLPRRDVTRALATRATSWRPSASVSSGLETRARCAVDTCRYRVVFRIDRCPSSTWIVRKSSPASSRWVANECRNACMVTRRSMPRAAAAQWTARLTVSGHNGLLRSWPGKSNGPGGRVSRQYSRRASSSRCGSITRRGRPPCPGERE